MRSSGTIGSFSYLLLAGIITVGLYHTSFGWYVTYPLMFFVTFIHESGHALAALISGGRFDHIMIDPGAGGVTWTAGGNSFLIVSSGYLSTTCYGVMLFLLSRWSFGARSAMLATGLVITLLTLSSKDTFTFFVGFCSGIGTLLLAMRGSREVVVFCVSFIAIQCILNAFSDLTFLIHLSTYETSVVTDAQIMAHATGVPSIVWALAWFGFSVAMSIVGFYLYSKTLTVSQLATY